MKTSPSTLPYICASIPAWREQARNAIMQGQSEAEFVAHCHPDNRTNSRAAYRMERAAMMKHRGISA